MGDYLRRVKLDYARAIEQYARASANRRRNADLLRGIGQAEQTLGRWDARCSTCGRRQRLDPRSVGDRPAADPGALWRDGTTRPWRAADRWIALAPATPGHRDQGDDPGSVGATSPGPGRSPSSRRRGPARPGSWPTSPPTGTCTGLLTDEQRRLLLRLPPSAFDDDRASWGLSIAGAHPQGRRPAGPGLRRLGPDRVRGADPPEPGRRAAPLALRRGARLCGGKAEAIREGERGLAMHPVTADAFAGPYFQHQLARIYIAGGRAGEGARPARAAAPDALLSDAGLAPGGPDLRPTPEESAVPAARGRDVLIDPRLRCEGKTSPRST